MTNLSKSVTTEAAIFIGLKNPEFDKSDHGGLFDARVGLLRAVGHQLREQRCLLHLLAEFDLQRSDHLSTSGQETVQHTLAGTGLLEIKENG